MFQIEREHKDIEFLLNNGQKILDNSIIPKKHKEFLKPQIKEFRKLYYKVKECSDSRQVEHIVDELKELAEKTFANKNIPLSRKQWDSIYKEYIVPTVTIGLVEQMVYGQSCQQYLMTSKIFLVNGLFQVVGSIYEYVSRYYK